MKLIFQGNVLHDSTSGDETLVQFYDGESLIVAVKPKPPSKHIRKDFIDDDEEEDLKFQLPESSGRWKKRLYFMLQNKLRLPDMLLMAIFPLTLKMWAAILLWFVLAPVAHRYGFGTWAFISTIIIQIIGTGFLIIFYNLEHRQPGDVSASLYSMKILRKFLEHSMPNALTGTFGKGNFESKDRPILCKNSPVVLLL